MFPCRNVHFIYFLTIVENIFKLLDNAFSYQTSNVNVQKLRNDNKTKEEIAVNVITLDPNDLSLQVIITMLT